MEWCTRCSRHKPDDMYHDVLQPDDSPWRSPRAGDHEAREMVEETPAVPGAERHTRCRRGKISRSRRVLRQRGQVATQRVPDAVSAPGCCHLLSRPRRDARASRMVGSRTSSFRAAGQLLHVLAEGLRCKFQPLDHRQVRKQLIGQLMYRHPVTDGKRRRLDQFAGLGATACTPISRPERVRCPLIDALRQPPLDR